MRYGYVMIYSIQLVKKLLFSVQGAVIRVFVGFRLLLNDDFLGFLFFEVLGLCFRVFFLGWIG